MRTLIFILLTILVQACSSSENTREISGIIAFDPVPVSFEGLIMTVSIEAASTADAPSVNVIEKSYFNIHFQPVPFNISYDLSTINKNTTYSISVKVYDDAKNIAYLNKINYPVITNEILDRIEIVVESVN